MIAVSQNLGTLTINSNDSQFTVTGGDAESGLLGSAPTTSGDSITGSAAANLTITAGSNDTLNLDGKRQVCSRPPSPPGRTRLTRWPRKSRTAINNAMNGNYSARHECDHVQHRPRPDDRGGSALPR